MVAEQSVGEDLGVLGVAFRVNIALCLGKSLLS
jgi:hypothetical protein